MLCSKEVIYFTLSPPAVSRMSICARCMSAMTCCWSFGQLILMSEQNVKLYPEWLSNPLWSHYPVPGQANRIFDGHILWSLYKNIKNRYTLKQRHEQTNKRSSTINKTSTSNSYIRSNSYRDSTHQIIHHHQSATSWTNRRCEAQATTTRCISACCPTKYK